MGKVGRAFCAKLIGLATLAVVWELATATLGAYWVPGIAAVAERTWVELLRGALLRDMVSTGFLFASGTTIGLLMGAGAACLLRSLPRLDHAVQPLITALMSVPKLALVPLLVLWFGSGWMPKVLLVVLTVLFIVFALTYSGLSTINPHLVTTAMVLGATPLQVTRHIVLPSVWPFVLTGLEVALPWGVSAAIVAEILSAQAGIGHGIEQARQMSDSVGVFYGIVVATVLVLVCNAGLSAIRRLTVKGA